MIVAQWLTKLNFKLFPYCQNKGERCSPGTVQMGYVSRKDQNQTHTVNEEAKKEKKTSLHQIRGH
jgi:hypothetical protein